MNTAYLLKQRVCGSGCEYGDQNDPCDVALCSETLEDGGLYSDICCETCATVTTVTTTAAPDATTGTTDTQSSTTTTGITDTPPSTATTGITETPPSTATTGITETPPSTVTTATSTAAHDSTTGITEASSSATTTGICADSGLQGQTCQQYIEQNGEVKCYENGIYKLCCQTCQSKQRANSTGCEYGDKEVDFCKSFDFTSITLCNTTLNQQCCARCAELTSRIPTGCQDGNGVGALSCPEYVKKYGKIKCYEDSVTSACCLSCYGAKELQHKDCEYGNRITTCPQMKYEDYSSDGCNNFTRQHCCAQCRLFDIQRTANGASSNMFQFTSVTFSLVLTIYNTL